MQNRGWWHAIISKRDTSSGPGTTYSTNHIHTLLYIYHTRYEALVVSESRWPQVRCNDKWWPLWGSGGGDTASSGWTGSPIRWTGGTSGGYRHSRYLGNEGTHNSIKISLRRIMATPTWRGGFKCHSFLSFLLSDTWYKTLLGVAVTGIHVAFN